MRTLVIVGLVVGPVVVLGAPLALASSGVTLPPDWTASAAFALAGLAALGGVVLLALSFRPRRSASPAAAAPAAAPEPAAPPLAVVHNARPGRYVAAVDDEPDTIVEPDPVTTPGIVTLRPRDQARPAPRRQTVGAR